MSILNLLTDYDNKGFRQVVFSHQELSEDFVALHSRQFLIIGLIENNNDCVKFRRLFEMEFSEITHFIWLQNTPITQTTQILRFCVVHKEINRIHLSSCVLSCDENGIKCAKKTLLICSDWVLSLSATTSSEPCLVAVSCIDGMLSIIDVDSDSNSSSLHLSLTRAARRLCWNSPENLFYLDNGHTLHQLVLHPLLHPYKKQWSTKALADLSPLRGNTLASLQMVQLQMLVICSENKVLKYQQKKFEMMDLPPEVKEFHCLLFHPSIPQLGAVIYGRRRTLGIVHSHSRDFVPYGTELLHECQSVSWHNRMPWLLVAMHFHLKLITMSL